MYRYDDIVIIEKQLKKFLIYFAATTIVFLVGLIIVCKNWGTILDPIRLPVWPAYILGMFYAVYTVFSWSLIGTRLIKYRNFVYNIIAGLERSIVGKIVEIDKNISYDNDLEFYNIEIKENDNEENRYLRIDATKNINVFEIGKSVEVKVFGNYIKDIVS